MCHLSTPTVQEGHISELEISDSFDVEKNNPTFQEKQVNSENDRTLQEEEATIAETVKLVLEGGQAFIKIVSLDWCQFVLDKLIRSVKHYKETKAAKGVRFNGLLFFLDDTVMKKATAELHSAHVEFAKLQTKQQPNKDDNFPPFSPTSAVAHPGG
ncbi:hypothetical protein Cgig2_023234 [Carnegiea gigantea]|uniref:Uncharacterized protein n=1 Tax=Carnegiea gigantea TaxID=171969 RepID=A0A9Q1JG28_9CARY|nr:hypothetical protein Cgig2_023234 [Carnegiea gigantea]